MGTRPEHAGDPPVPLRVHGAFTFLTGVGTPASFLDRARELGHEALAVTDTEGLYGALHWERAARGHAVRVILGVELAFATRRPARPEGRVLLWAQDLAGYRTLCRLVTARQLARAAQEGLGEDPVSLPHHGLPEELLHGEACDHLVVACDDPHLLARLSNVVPRDRLYAALDLRPRARSGGTPAPADAAPAHVPAAEEELPFRKAPDPLEPLPPQVLVDAARQLGVPLLACDPVYYPLPADERVHAHVLAIKHNRLAAHLDPRAVARDAHLIDPHAMRERYAAFPEALANTRAVAERCRLELPLGGIHFPRCDLPRGETPFSHLWNLVMQGARRRYRPLTHAVMKRLEYELEVIDRLGFPEYFLLVKRIADHARAEGIPLVGRGSAADSMTAYVLELTAADPLRYDLPFERFLNPSRTDRPDIDLDFCWRRRDEVIDFVYRTFQSDRTAMIATVNTFGLRAAFREVSKVAGVAPHDISRWSSVLPHHHEDGLWKAIECYPECRAFPRDDATLRTVVDTAERLLGTPRHLGLHPGGVIVAPEPLTQYLPLERAAKGVIVSQFDKDDVEELGLVKMDLLGNRGLTTLDDTLKFLAARPEPVTIDLQAIPENDPKTGALLAAGDTIGCFQVESPGMRNLLKQIGAFTMDRVIQAVALIRPGPAASGMKDAFARRVRGLEPVEFLHAALEPVLRETFGIMLYQEDILRVAEAIAGMDRGAGDALRRAMKGKGTQRVAMRELAERFFRGARERGVDERSTRAIWRLMSNFASFSFCKAHAVTYGRMAYHAAYLKAHHPLEFLTAFLASETGYYDRSVYVHDVRRRGIEILPPDVNRSASSFTVERFPRSPNGTRRPAALRVGLAMVRGLRERTIERILDTRRDDGPLLSLQDFVARVDPARDELENLILTGAFDAFDRTRPELLWRAQLLLGRPGHLRGGGPRRGAASAPSLFGEDPEFDLLQQTRAARPERTEVQETAGWDRRQGDRLFPPPRREDPVIPGLPEYDEATRAELEMELLGFTVSTHPMDFFQELVDRHTPVPCAELDAWKGAYVSIVGWLVTSRRTRTRTGLAMRFLSLEDRSGIVEAVLFPEVYQKFGQRIRGRGPFLLRGKVEDQMGSTTLHVSYAEALDGEA